MKAIDVAYDEEEIRGFIKLRGTALILTAAGIVFFLVVIALIAALPPVLHHLSTSPIVTVVVQVAVAAAARIVTVALRCSIGCTGSRRAPAALGLPGCGGCHHRWFVVSVLFSLYASKSGSYGKGFGVLAGIAVSRVAVSDQVRRTARRER